ncbi:FmdB family zinc ribbon protein [Plantactinospora sp. ZYX-F-223]|uniref:FmdB family zinc ribbon protein n=1 Tax=Plantactinospora sp. ZYX-F-223 TaxID=3144103 RepID=UPI0031FC6A73
MPTYQYACTECGHQLEAVQSFTDEPLTECPACEGRLRKLFNSVGIVFKGSGFYRTDSRSNGSEGAGSSTAAKSDSSKSDSTKTGSGGDSGSTSGGTSSSTSGGGSGSTNGASSGSGSKPKATSSSSTSTT